MSDGTKIEWTDATWNPITGCAVVSPGCTNCYAMQLAGTRLKHHPSRTGLTHNTKAGPVWTGEVRFNPQWLDQPTRWIKPRMIFVCAHGDLFAEGVEDIWLDQIFSVMACSQQHTFQVLTKRPERMRDYLTGKLLEHRLANLQTRFTSPIPEPYRWPHMPLPNVWLGVSVEDQKRADERIPILIDTPAAVRWISAEPLLGDVDLSRWLQFAGYDTDLGISNPGLDWIVAGGESGPGARPMHPDWARSLRDQCANAHVPFFFKQWGNWHQTYDRDREDPDWQRCSEVARSTPKGRWLNLAGGQGFHGDRVIRLNPTSKVIAGRLLDGAQHNAQPGAQS